MRKEQRSRVTSLLVLCALVSTMRLEPWSARQRALVLFQRGLPFPRVTTDPIEFAFLARFIALIKRDQFVLAVVDPT